MKLNNLADIYPKTNYIFTSRGISALYCALLAVKKHKGQGEVIVPASVCPSVVLAILYSGLIPSFCDVELNTFCLSKATLEQKINSNTVAVIVVYLFGKSTDIESICHLCSKNKIFVIEDLAHSIGGKINGNYLGHYGDFSILSFNDAKILPGSAGVLLLKDSSHKPYIEYQLESLPEPPDISKRNELSNSFRNLTHGIYDLVRSEDLSISINFFSHLAHYYKPLFIYQNKNLDAIKAADMDRALINISNQKKQRFDKYKLYKEYLSKKIKIIAFNEDEMCWRLPLMLKNHNQQLKVINQLRTNNYLVSNHYFPISNLFNDKSPENAREIGLRSINLWVDNKVSASEIPVICDLINKTTANF